MNAIRPDETLDNIHSLYGDQWDWERIISGEERQLDFLKRIVGQIYDVIRRTEKYICQHYPVIEPILSEEITFFHSEDLEKMYPEMTPKQREKEVCKQFGSVFVIGIGASLNSGSPHDDRAPDYDDWTTPYGEGKKGLNGDILIYYPLLDCAYELSSMGIRVDPETLKRQLKIKGCPERKDLYFHNRLLNNELPLSIGGGIGQSRLCMFYLRKAHIGEIQSSIWPKEMIEKCYENGIMIL
jgi:aspartate--ammonia ligase